MRKAVHLKARMATNTHHLLYRESGQWGRRTMEERKSTTRAVPLLDKTGAD